jgi:hypothetical protein
MSSFSTGNLDGDVMSRKPDEVDARYLALLTSHGREYTGTAHSIAHVLRQDTRGEIVLSAEDRKQFIEDLYDTLEKHLDLIKESIIVRQGAYNDAHDETH